MYAPNLVEVETIKFKMTKILNTVYYPNDTEGVGLMRKIEFEIVLKLCACNGNKSIEYLEV